MIICDKDPLPHLLPDGPRQTQSEPRWTLLKDVQKTHWEGHEGSKGTQFYLTWFRSLNRPRQTDNSVKKCSILLHHLIFSHRQTVNWSICGTTPPWPITVIMFWNLGMKIRYTDRIFDPLSVTQAPILLELYHSHLLRIMTFFPDFLDFQDLEKKMIFFLDCHCDDMDGHFVDHKRTHQQRLGYNRMNWVKSCQSKNGCQAPNWVHLEL